MNLDRFAQSTAGRVVAARQDATEYWAFVPHPLPPALALDPSLVRILSEADRALGELAGLGRMLPNPELLIGPFVRREAVLSSRIEGTQTNIADLYAYEAGQLTLSGMQSLPPESDVREVLNYVHTLRYGLDRLATLPISLRLIRELHERLMDGVRGQEAAPGEFRRIQNWIGRARGQLQEAEYIPPPVSELQACLDALERYFHSADDYPPLMRIAFIHYQFEAIHPFRDGNGRIGRLLISLLLHHWQLLPAPLLSLSAYFDRRRNEYYDRLLAVSERGDWVGWLDFFLQGVAEQSRDAINRARGLQEIQQEWRRQVTQARSSAVLIGLVDLLFETPFLSIPQAADALEVTYHSARRGIERLVEAGILRPYNETSYGRIFVAEAILQILNRPDG